MRRRALAAVRDLADDVAINVGRSPVRSFLLGTGAAVACGVLAFSIVTSSTEASRVANRFDALAATRLQVNLPLVGGTYRRLGAAQLRALTREAGILGIAWMYQRDVRLTTRTEPHWDIDVSVRQFDVGGDPNVLQVRRGALGAGVWVGGAADLGGTLPPNAVVEIDGRPTMVAGALRRSELIPEMLSGLLRYAPSKTVDVTRSGRMVVQARLGWADLAARRLQTQLDPIAPDRVLVRYPPEAASLRAEVVTRVDSLVLVVTGALLLVSAVAVGLATFARALERRRLIGMLRAIGASRSSIVLGLATEAAVVGALAGGLGALTGMVAAVTATRTGGGVVVPWTLIAVTLGVAFVVNGLGATLPAWAATRISPIQAIRDL